MIPRPMRIITIIALFALSCTACQSERVASMADLDWQPDLDQPIEQLEESLKNAESQTEMNYTSSNLGFALDAKLYKLFSEYLATIPRERRAKAIIEQKQWIVKREKKTDNGYMEYAGGSLAPLSGNKAYIEITKERITELASRLPEIASYAYEPKIVELTGFIRRQRVPDPSRFHPDADYEGKPETYLVLRLSRPIKVSPDSSSESNSEGASDITDIQLCNSICNAKSLSVGDHVTLQGTLFHAHTGHHHETILMNVIEVRKP